MLAWLVEDAVPWEEVGLVFAVGLGTGPAWALVGAVAGVAAFYSWRRAGGLGRRWRAGLAALRGAGLGLALFLALGPALTGQRVEAGRDVVLLLFDDSRSMQIRGRDGLSRGQRLQATLAAGDGRFEQALAQRHRVARFAFGGQVERLRRVGDLKFGRPLSDPAAAVRRAVAQMAGVDVAAVVLFADGVVQGAKANGRVKGGPPVFAVDSGDEGPWRSLELDALRVSRTGGDGHPVAVEAQVQSVGLDGQRLRFEVLQGSRVVAAQSLEAAPGQEQHRLRVEFAPVGDGWLTYRGRVQVEGPAADLDPVEHNNVRDFVVDNRQRPYRILYVGGRPNWELAFLRRALAADPRLELSGLVRVSGAERAFRFRGGSASLANPLFEGTGAAAAPRYDEAVFLRFGPGAEGLADGYPLDEETLFAYDLVVWGDVERAFFTLPQLELSREFVVRRGGSLLVTGGPRALAAGGYAGTLVESFLPVVLGHAAPADGPGPSFRAQPTIEGLLSGTWALDADPQRNQRLWAGLPPLAGVNRTAMTRAGAAVLARVQTAAPDLDGQPLGVWQRYGEGTSAVLATGETWPWHMRDEEEQGHHGRFWRQWVRALAQRAPRPVVLENADQEIYAGQEGRLSFVVRDGRFRRREGLSLEVEAIGGAGRRPLPVEESLADEGRYEAVLGPAAAGLYRIVLEARDAAGEAVGTLEEAVLVRPDRREWHRARPNAAYLAELAAANGGRFFRLEELDQVIEALPRSKGQRLRPVRQDLWHRWPFYVLVVALLGGEWYLRRRKGLA